MTKYQLLIEIGKKFPTKVARGIFDNAEKWSAEMLKKLLDYWSK